MEFIAAGCGLSAVIAIAIAVLAFRLGRRIGNWDARKKTDEWNTKSPARQEASPEKIVVVPGRVVIDPGDLPRPVTTPRSSRQGTLHSKRSRSAVRIARRMWR